MKAFWYRSKNIGDTLTPIILEHFTGEKVEYVEKNERNKIIAVGSIMKALRNGDTVWGAGVMREYDEFPNKERCRFLALRGKLSEKILGVKCGVYGDPALLLPLMYSPKIEKKHTLGVIPHYIEADHDFFKRMEKDGCKMIDVLQDWKTFIDEILSCDRIISSSLHGIIIAEAYGIPATWVHVTEKVIGNGFKFRDYLSGTGRELPLPSGENKNIYHFPPIQNLKEIQDKLIESLNEIARIKS